MGDSIDYDGVTELGPHRVKKRLPKPPGDGEKGPFTPVPDDHIRLECIDCGAEIQGTQEGVKNLAWEDCINTPTVQTESGVVEVPKKFLPDRESPILSLKCRKCGIKAEYGNSENGRWYCVKCSGGL